MVDVSNLMRPLAIGFNQLSFINHQLLQLVSVIGLAPIRLYLKGRVRGLLCIHGLKKVEGCRVVSCRFTDAHAGDNLQPATFNLQRDHPLCLRVL